MIDRRQVHREKSVDALALRKRAEEHSRILEPISLAAMTHEEIQQLIQEQRVHQIELEMQNEELRTTQARIEAGQARYFELYDLAPVGYCTLSEQGLILEANFTAATLLGETRSALVMRPISRFICKEDRNVYYQHRLQLLETGVPLKCELRLVKPDGGFIWVHLTGTVAQMDDGKPVCRVVLSDITERKNTEAAMQESQAAYQQRNEILSTLLDNLTSGVFMVEAQSGRPIIANLAAERLLGCGILPDCSKENLSTVYRAHKPGCADPYPVEEMPIVKGMYGEVSHVDDMIVQRPDGSEIWLEIFGSPVRNHHGQVWASLASFHDITERRQAEAEREKLQSQLAHAQKMESVGRLAGGVAHDFNNMLGVILGYTEMALEVVSPDEPLNAGLTAIKEAAKRSADLTHQLLTYARKQVVLPKVVDLNDTIEKMLKLLRQLVDEDIDLAWQPSKEVWPIKMDTAQIDKILANLVVNARDAIAGAGKVTIETGKATFDEEYCSRNAGFVTGDYVLLSVSDNGCGMDAQTRVQIFEPFFTTKEMGKGTGLGLATVYGMVRQNNGFINVYSEPGQGTTFRIYLPRHAVKEDVETGKNQLEAARASEIVLLVEDEPAILTMTTMMLERFGYTVLATDNPVEAIRLTEEHSGRIDLLLTDVVMPEMNGRDLARKLLSINPNIRQLFMSGYTADVITHHGELDEGVHFIQKPFTLKDLETKLREVLER